MTVALRSIAASTAGVASPVAPTADATVTAYATYVTDAATFAAALATCVADGASPTQAHVTAANSAYTTLAGDWTALKAVIDGNQTAAGHKVTVTFDVTDFSDWGLLNAALRAVSAQAIAAGFLKP